MANPSTPWPPGEVVGAYRVVRHLGEGGMAVVYEGVHQSLGHRVAIKTLLPELLRRPTTLARFQREGRAVARVVHPNVIRVFDVGEHHGVPYLVMEYLDGAELSAQLRGSSGLPLEDALDILLPVFSAVQAAHDRGLIHRDLKPSNIVLARDDAGRRRPVVLDFGIARGGEDHPQAITQTSDMLGTPAYLAPEQTHGSRGLTTALDQYALGVIAYECLSGHLAFGEDPTETVFSVLIKIREGAVTPLRTHRPDLPEEVLAAIRRAMALAPADRFPSVGALAAALLPFASVRAQALWSDDFGSAPPRGALPAVLGLQSTIPHELPENAPKTLDEGLPTPTSTEGISLPAPPIVPTRPLLSPARVAVALGALLGVAGVLLALRRPDTLAPQSRDATPASSSDAAVVAHRLNADAGPATQPPPRPSPDAAPPAPDTTRADPPDARAPAPNANTPQGTLPRTSTHSIPPRCRGPNGTNLCL
ncbi:MAG: protein kinase [Deltaproteobacteria bacterium]|nr:protein kinase [Deltaproteobacteria bacterium]